MIDTRPVKRSLAGGRRGWALQAAAWLVLGLQGVPGAAWALGGAAYVAPDRLAGFVSHAPPAEDAAFGSANAAALRQQRRGVRPAEATVLYATWENPWAGAGGLLAVAKQIVRPLAKRSALVCPLSPRHGGLRDAAPAPLEDEGLPFTTHFAGRSVPTRLVLRHDASGAPWLLLDSPWAFFKAGGGAGGTNPYCYRSELPWEADGPQSKLLRDALFFCKAVPAMLTAALRTRPADLPPVGANGALGDILAAWQQAAGGFVYHANDWQTATAALTLAEAQLHRVPAGDRPVVPRPLTTVLTLHNLFDHVLPDDVLGQITGRAAPAHWPAIGADGALRPGTRHTVLARMLPLFGAPPSVVSDGYAHEIAEGDPLARVFGGHLADVLRATGLTGIPNGNFMDASPPFTSAAYEAARGGDFAPILAAKGARRAALAALLDPNEPETIVDARAIGSLGRVKELPADVPLFFFFGRFDAAQKGFDVITRAIEQLDRQGFEGRYVFAPAVDDRTDPFWKDLEGLATRVPGKVIIFPFRMARGYLELMRGATAAVMASNYEPFGAATEPLLLGTPVVARRTGGLVDQVPATVGWSYREQAQGTADEQVAEWRRILDAPTPAARMEVPLYRALVDGLAGAMAEAGRVFRDQPDHFGALLAAGYEHAHTFGWSEPTAQYRKLYEAAAARGR